MGMDVAPTIAIKSADGSYQRNAQTFMIPAKAGTVGASAGYVSNNNTGLVTMPASTGASTWVIPITCLKKGDVITSFKITGQLEAGGNNNTLDADLRATTAVAAASSDASIGAITQLIKTADYQIDDEKTGLSHTVISGNGYYVLVTGTTLAATDQEIIGIEITVNQR